MKKKNIILRQEADWDIDDALSFYISESASAGYSFLDEVEHALKHIAQHPASGSNRYAHALNFPGLKSWRLSRFPYIILYFEYEASIHVLRMFHTKRDISHLLLSSDME